MMTTTQQTPSVLKFQESLDNVFHVLFTRSMYTEIENRSTDLHISKGALIRLALDEYFKNLNGFIIFAVNCVNTG